MTVSYSYTAYEYFELVLISTIKINQCAVLYWLTTVLITVSIKDLIIKLTHPTLSW